MKPRIALLDDPAIRPLPTYTARDVERAWSRWGGHRIKIGLGELASLNLTIADVLVLPYLDGDLSGAPLEGLIRFHKQGGGLVFLGDTPHVGRSYPYRNSQAPELRLTRCRDPLVIRGLTDLGKQILGDLPGWDSVVPCSTTGVRTSAFAPDECHDLLVCEAGFKQLSPIVLVERRHPDFLGAKAVIVGFDGGEPRENILGVCKLEWRFHPGLLTRDWAGADTMVARLVEAVRPARAAFALELDPVLPAGRSGVVAALARNLTGTPLELRGTVRAGGKVLGSFQKNLAPGAVLRVAEFPGVCELGPQDFEVRPEGGEGTVARTRFGFLDHPGAPQGNMGFSVYRVFRETGVDDAYRDFLRTTGKLGMQYARLNVAWEDIEPEPGRYVWDVPDQLLAACAQEGLPAFFWVFPTARGSGLSDGGVPEWSLREPSIDRFGKPGNFPCVWSPFYRERYFGFLEALVRRYATDSRLGRFVFDFGNSDFAYSYHYYGGRADEFDYSPHEQKAFARWLEEHAFPLEELSRRWGGRFVNYSEVPVPLSEEREAWLLYEEFRAWGVHQGIKQAVEIIHRLAPQKAPPDFPGHGLGSIADISTYVTHAQCSRWDQVSKFPHELVEAHNAGPQWGGEAWQVGGRFPDYDDAVFQSVRLEADYFSIPGPDLGVWENDVARIAMIRRSLAGARREHPRIAIMDRMAWNDWGSLCQVGARLDQPVDLVSKTCRYDYSCYDLLVLPPDEVVQTNRGGMSLLPLDDDYYSMILEAVRQGLKVLLFPRTGLGDPLNPMRRIWGLDAVAYGERRPRTVDFPESWGGGEAAGACHSVQAVSGDEVLLTDRTGEPVLVFRSFGKGGFLLAGHDAAPDSLDGPVRYDTEKNLRHHSLARLAAALGIESPRLCTGQAGVYKEYLRHPEGGGEFLLFFSHLPETLEVEVRFRPDGAASGLFELSSGDVLEVLPDRVRGWFVSNIPLIPRRGYYFKIL